MVRALKRQRKKVVKKTKRPQQIKNVQIDYHLAQVVGKHLRTGDRKSAEKVCNGILHLSPNDLKIFKELGLSLYHEGRYDDSVFIFRWLVGLKPELVDPRVILGKILLDSDKCDEAIVELENALNLYPSTIKAYQYLGWAYLKLKKIEPAIQAFETALKDSPVDPMTYSGLGNALVIMGKLNEAEECYKYAIKLDPRGSYYRALTRVKRYTEYDNDVSQMEKLYRSDGKSVNEKVDIAFALGKVFEDLKNYDSAFQYISEANRLIHGPQKYNMNKVREDFTKIKDIFNQSLLTNYSLSGCEDESPIFIVGMPRSATSLTEQILSSHPEVHGGGELSFLYEIVDQFSKKHTKSSFPENMSQLTPFFKEMGSAYINRIRELSVEKKCVVDKMPHNFIFLGLIRLILPNAKIIHCRRNPLDIIWSMFKNTFDGGEIYAYDLQELGEYYALYHDLMRYWNQALEGHIFDIVYEELIAEPSQVIEKMLNHCGLEWHVDCENFNKTERNVHTSSNVQVRRPLYKSSVQIWKNYEKQLAPLVEKLSGEGCL